MAEFAGPAADMVLCHFIVSDDVDRSCRFYTEVLGGRLIFSHGDLRNVALANSFIVINLGGGPTDDKPAVTLETPPNADRTWPTAPWRCRWKRPHRRRPSCRRRGSARHARSYDVSLAEDDARQRSFCLKPDTVAMQRI